MTAFSFDNHKNFAISVVAVAPVPPLSGLGLTVAAGEGSLFPAAPFNAVVFPSDVSPISTNAEVVRVTNRVGDVFTIVRAQEGSNPRSVQVGDRIMDAVTAKALTDIEADVLYLHGDSGPITVNDVFNSSQHIGARSGASGHVEIGDEGPAGESGIYFGDHGTVLYEFAVGELKLVGKLRAGGRIIANTGLSTQIDLDDDGHIYFGSSADTDLGRISAGIAGTTGGLSAARNDAQALQLPGASAGVTIGGDTVVKRIAAGVPGGGSSGDTMAFHRHPYGNLRHIESGSVSVTTSGANGSGSASVSWTDAFASAPKVVACTNGVTPMSSAHTDSITTTGATIFAANFNGTGASTFAVHYIAEGQD